MPSFWDMQKRLAARRRAGGADEGLPRAPKPQQPVRPKAPGADGALDELTVTQLTARIKAALQQGLPGQIVVRGEVSDWTHAASGHRYFCLKDKTSSLSCVMWQTDAATLRFEPAIGQEIIAAGYIETYAARGEYQLKCHRLEPAGQGARELAHRQLLEKLQREGLFERARKKSLPLYPQRICILTSAQAAGYHDVLKVLRSCRFLSLLLYPVPVQGEAAAQRIVEALAHVSKSHGDVGGIDVVLLVRGGGAPEDLWCFNEEPLVRALAAMPIPVITGIGHEIDRTIADMVADYEAHTPTEAAQVLVRHWKNARQRVDQLGIVLRRDGRELLRLRREELAQPMRHEMFTRPAEGVNRRRRRLDELGFALGRALRGLARRTSARLRGYAEALQRAHPRQKLALDRGRVAELGQRLGRAQERLLASRHNRLNGATRQLAALDPTAVLARGYSLTVLHRTGMLLRSAGETRPGDLLLTRTADGEVQSTVGRPNQAKLFE